MTNRVKRFFAIIAVVTILAISAMTATVSAATVSPLSNKSNWKVSTMIPVYPSSVTGLVHGTDTGVTFRCNYFMGDNTQARATLNNAQLLLNPGEGVNITYNGDYGTILFTRGWYDLCGGTVEYKVALVYGVATVGGFAE